MTCLLYVILSLIYVVLGRRCSYGRKSLWISLVCCVYVAIWCGECVIYFPSCIYTVIRPPNSSFLCNKITFLSLLLISPSTIPFKIHDEK